MVKYAYPILPWGVVLIQLSYAIAQSGNDGDLSPYSTVNISNSNNNNHPLYGGYDNTMSIIAGVLISVLFVMGIIALFLRQCRSDQAIRLGNGTGTRRGVTERSRTTRTPRGIDQATIEKFPIFLYSDVKEHKIGKVSLECAVCLNEFEDDDILRLLPKCDHVFHPLCIDAWLVSHITCPVCRANLKSLLGEIPTVGGGATGGSAGGGGTELSVYEVNEGENQLSIQVMHSPLLNNIRNPSEIQSQSPITRSSPLFPRFIRKFPRSHSTGHSLVLPGENVERFTLKLPEEVRRILNRTRSFIALPNGDGSDSGENTGKGGGGGGGESSRGRNHRFVKLPREGKLDQAKVPTGMSFFTRNSPARSWKSEGNESTSTPLPI